MSPRTKSILRTLASVTWWLMLAAIAVSAVVQAFAGEFWAALYVVALAGWAMSDWLCGRLRAENDRLRTRLILQRLDRP